MTLPNFAALLAQADALPRPVPIAAAGGADPTVLQALHAAAERGWILPTVTGSLPHIRSLAESLDLSLERFTLLEDDADSSRVAVSEVRRGAARMLMKGQISTPALMQGILHREQGLRTGRTIGQIVLMEIPRDQKVFLLADTGVTVAPTLEQKADLLRSVVETAQRLGVKRPRVAVLSATEKPNEALPDTLDAVVLAQRSQTGELGHCQVEGPLSFDLAYAAEAGQRKRVGGEVTGAADALLFPNLLAANLTVKGIMYTADCLFGGILCGAACPIVFMSRADAVETRLRSLAFALRMIDTTG